MAIGDCEALNKLVQANAKLVIHIANQFVGRGLDLIVELNRQKHRIEARSVELLPPLPQGAEVLAAYVTSG